MYFVAAKRARALAGLPQFARGDLTIARWARAVNGGGAENLDGGLTRARRGAWRSYGTLRGNSLP